MQKLNILLRIMIIISLVLGTCVVSTLGIITVAGFTSCGLEKDGFTPALFNRHSITLGDKILGVIKYDEINQMVTVINPDGSTMVKEVSMGDTIGVTSLENDVELMYTDIRICWSQLWVRQHRPHIDGEGSF